MNTYQENGYANRAEYLRSMSDEYGIDLATVHALANALGPQEDFDGLVVALEDAENETEKDE